MQVTRTGTVFRDVGVTIAFVFRYFAPQSELIRHGITALSRGRAQEVVKHLHLDTVTTAKNTVLFNVC